MATKRFRRIQASCFKPSHRQCVPDGVQIFFFFLPYPEVLDSNVERQTILLIIVEALDGNKNQNPESDEAINCVSPIPTSEERFKTDVYSFVTPLVSPVA